jgi:putative membrane protein insertion efficiency factor
MSVVLRVLVGLVRFYQVVISQALHVLTGPGSGCRFEPTCSDYMLVALQRFGPWRGTALGLRRICRCHPLGGVGFDPVPPADGAVSGLVEKKGGLGARDASK